MNRRHVAKLAQQYARCPPGRLSTLLEQRLAADPNCPVTRYLLGCQCFDSGRPASAVRHMMIVHHRQPQFESAALLAFAGLNWISRRATPLLPVLLLTWEEFRRPQFDRQASEQALLDAFAAPDPGLTQLPLLARRLWRLPIDMLRKQISAAVRSRDAGLYPLLGALA